MAKIPYISFMPLEIGFLMAEEYKVDHPKVNFEVSAILLDEKEGEDIDNERYIDTQNSENFTDRIKPNEGREGYYRDREREFNILTDKKETEEYIEEEELFVKGPKKSRNKEKIKMRHKISDLLNKHVKEKVRENMENISNFMKYSMFSPNMRYGIFEEAKHQQEQQKKQLDKMIEQGKMRDITNFEIVNDLDVHQHHAVDIAKERTHENDENLGRHI